MKAIQPLFQRSSFVRQEVLLGSVSLEDYYEIDVKKIGKGSFGSVVTARHLGTGTTRAIKILDKPKADSIMRLKREISIMKRLDHPNIIRLFEVFEDSTLLYLVMELCTGGELFDRIVKSGHFSEYYAATIMKQIFSAVSYCHRNNVMHRDLKPENVLYSDGSPLSSLKIIDWGFAAKCSKNHKFTSVLGTPYYVAPEVLYENYDKRCDLWSSGVILFILLSGIPPFYGKDNKEILSKVKRGEFSFEGKTWENISNMAKQLVRSLLSIEPCDRISASEALQHPWIKCYAQPDPSHTFPLSKELGNILIHKFRRFQKQMKLKKLAVTVIAYQIAETDISSLHQIFTALDKNGDGVLTVSEMCTALVNMDVMYGEDIIQVIKDLDTDGNGTIDYTEFIAALLDRKIYEKENICKAAFHVFDLDGDGKITIDEIKKVFELNFIHEVFKREAIESIVQEVDKNCDGMIDFDEFMTMMQENEHTSPRTKISHLPKTCKFSYGKS